MIPLDRERWARLEPLLDEALELSPEELTPWLERLRAGAPELAEEIAALLARESGPRSAWLESNPSALLAERPGLAGQTLGPYTLDEPIGYGGMGSVWLAHRNDGRFEGTVAVKLLNLALVGRAAEQRFVQEGTVLARLKHPNIAALLDAGVSGAGQPYLVLELVEGERIDVYADRLGLDARRRIALCVDVAAAVANAHANLVIHRDIKPSNVMVTGDGTVKLLDFGIAKLLDEGRPADGTVTAESSRALTPEYAAPEMILGEPVSTATDVYSLGVMLYVLLTGRHPFGARFETPSAALDAALHTDPVRLSDAVPQGRLRRLFAGDLDTVLGKALKRRPEERYQTAAAFADDLTRYLTDQPVTARADSWGYRAGKFIRRHRMGLSAAALVILSLVGGTWFAVREMRIAERQRDRAQEALQRSAASVSFETTLFRVLDRGRSYTYDELMERAREAVEKEFRADPVARMQIGIQFAQLYLRSDSARAAYAMLDKSRAIADSLGRPDWQGRTRCELAASLSKAGLADSALVLVRQGQRFLDGLPDLERGTLNACDNNAADAWLRLNRPDSAAPAYERAAARFRAEGDTLTEMYVIAVNNNARVLFGLRRMRDAGAAMDQLLNLSRQGGTSDPMSRVVIVLNRDLVTHQLGEFHTSRALLGSVVGDSTGIDSVAARAPVLRWRYALALQRTDATDSARYWIDRALADEAELGPAWAVSAHTVAADLAFRRGDQPGFVRHRDAVARLGQRLDTKAARELGYLRLLTMTAQGDSLAAKMAATLDSIGFGPGRPRQDRLLDHLLLAAERLNAAGRHGDARRYAAAVLETAAVDTLAWKRSGVIGAALYQRARSEIGQGELAAARASLRAADAPLRSGFGPDHRLVALAAALRDSIGR